MEPVDQSILFIVHDHVFVVKRKYDKIHEPIVKEALSDDHKKYTGQKDQGDPIGSIYES
ncbi:MAG: hypothetical protein ACJAUO_001273 [Sediminicola sp.]|jgi:hypothetical protein